MSEPSTAYAQQVICPAYVWQDPKQREALLTATATALAQQAHRDDMAIVGELVDADLHVTFLRAAVGTHMAVDFVAYEPCPEIDSDLVSVHLSCTVEPIKT